MYESNSGWENQRPNEKRINQKLARKKGLIYELKDEDGNELLTPEEIQQFNQIILENNSLRPNELLDFERPYNIFLKKLISL